MLVILEDARKMDFLTNFDALLLDFYLIIELFLNNII